MQSVEEALQRGGALLAAGNYVEAFAVYDGIARAHPQSAEAFSGAGIAASQNGNVGVAIGLFNAALMLAPKHPVLWGNLGMALRRAGHVDWARAAYKRSLENDPRYAPAIVGMCGTYVNDGNPAIGLEWGRKAMALDPGNDGAAHDLALCLMELGRWQEAWPLWRRRILHGHARRGYPGTYWRGEEVDWLIVHGEQGLGDEIMYLGCLPQLMDRARRGVIIEVEPRLVGLVQTAFPLAKVIGREADFVHPGAGAIAHIGLGDLPEQCAGGVPPKLSGYLRAGYDTAYQDAVLFAMNGGTQATHDYLRNPPLAEWAPVVEAVRAAGLRPVSIQYGPNGFAMANALGIEHDAEAAGNLDAQADAIASCKAMVSVQQTALHLGGALGADVFGVVSSKPAWRYGLKGLMPWYQTVTLHRQLPDDVGWGAVMRRTADAVTAMARREAA